MRRHYDVDGSVATESNGKISDAFAYGLDGIVCPSQAWCRGAKIEHVYQMSIPVHGQALNVTVHGYVDGLDFGLMAAANVVPDVEPLAAMLCEELDELEAACGSAA